MEVDSEEIGKNVDITTTNLSSRPSTRSLNNKQSNLNNDNNNSIQVRATRMSQNPDFAAKHRKFLNRVHDAISKSDDPPTDESSSNCGSPNSISVDKISDENSGKCLTRIRRLSEKRRRESVNSNEKCDTDTDKSNDSDNNSSACVSSNNSPVSSNIDNSVNNPSKKKKLSVKGDSLNTSKTVSTCIFIFLLKKIFLEWF